MKACVVQMRKVTLGKIIKRVLLKCCEALYKWKWCWMPTWFDEDDAETQPKWKKKDRETKTETETKTKWESKKEGRKKQLSKYWYQKCYNAILRLCQQHSHLINTLCQPWMHLLCVLQQWLDILWCHCELRFGQRSTQWLGRHWPHWTSFTRTGRNPTWSRSDRTRSTNTLGIGCRSIRVIYMFLDIG